MSVGQQWVALTMVNKVKQIITRTALGRAHAVGINLYSGMAMV